MNLNNYLLFLEANGLVVFLVLLLVVVLGVVAFLVIKKKRDEKDLNEYEKRKKQEKEEYDKLSVVGKVCRLLHPKTKEAFSFNGKYKIDWNNPDEFFLSGKKLLDREWDELYNKYVYGPNDFEAIVMLYLINYGNGWDKDYIELKDCVTMIRKWVEEQDGFNLLTNGLLKYALRIGTFRNKTHDKLTTINNLYASHFFERVDLEGEGEYGEKFILLNKDLFEKTNDDEFLKLTENFCALNELDINGIRNADINEAYNNMPDFDYTSDTYQYIYFDNDKLRDPKDIERALFYIKRNARKLYDD